MFLNYFKIAYRNFIRQRIYSIVNISGLAIGLTCFLLIFLYILDELSYDKFHSKSHRTYRLVEHFESEGVGEHSASQPFPAGPTLAADFGDQVVSMTRLFNFQSPSLALANRAQDKAFNESRVFFVDSGFFDVFDFELLVGDKGTALAEPNSILLTKSMATKYFGEADPMGKFLEFQENQQLQVTGILADAPHNSHFQFDFLGSFSSLKASFGGDYPSTWYWNPCWTYMVLEEGVSPVSVEKLFPDFVAKYFPPFIVEDVTLELQPLEAIHLTSQLDYEIEANSSGANLRIFGVVAIFVLLIAAINFINLSTARANKRAKEVGVRKSLGSEKGQLVTQFVVESVMLTFGAIVLALVVVMLALPSFNALTEKMLSFGTVMEPWMLAALALLTLLVGLLSGFYPAFVMSSFKTVDVLKSRSIQVSGFNFRRILVTFQFTISMVLIIGTIMVVRQLNLLLNDEVGFDKEAVVMVPVVRSPMGRHYESFKNQALKSPEILSVTAVEEIVGSKHQVNNYRFEGMDQSKPFPHFNVRHDFVQTMGLQLVAGRDYAYTYQTDDSLALVVNETLVKTMQWHAPEEAINKRFYYRGELKGKVIGVVKDYNFVSKHHPIAPLVIALNTRPLAFNLFIKYLAVKVDANQMEKAVADMETAWNQVVSNRPFDYFLLDQRLSDSYRAERKLSIVTIIFSGLAILVACLGLFGLTTYAMEQRKREIGIRKVLGISSAQIVVLLSKEFLHLINIAFLLAIPLAYYSLDAWLSRFAFRVDIIFWPFVLAGLITATIALMTMAFHSLKASLINPAETLKYE